MLSVLLLSGLLAAPAADAAPPSVAAEAAERDLDYERARDLWLEALVAADNEHERATAHAHLGVIYRILGDDGEARRHFEWLLSRNPHFRLPSQAPQRAVVFLDLIRSERIPGSGVPSPAGNAPSPIVIAAVGLGSSGALAGLGGGALWALAHAAQADAMALDVQTDRAAAYDRRDALATGAFVLGAVAGVLLLGTAGLGAAVLVTGLP